MRTAPPSSTSSPPMGSNDLLCYRATDSALRATEDTAWSPWTGWAEQRFGIALAITAGIMPVEQGPAVHAAFKTALEDMSDYTLAGLGVIVPALGSLSPRPRHRSGRFVPRRSLPPRRP